MEIKESKKIADMFSIFHDGYFESIEKLDEYLLLKVGVQYLAELLKKGN